VGACYAGQDLFGGIEEVDYDIVYGVKNEEAEPKTWSFQISLMS
jgi:hypothetical protein